MERLYLYALIRSDGQWGYIGATVDPKCRARGWRRDRPDCRFQVLVIGSEEYVLEMEKKLIRHCWSKGIPITNDKAHNIPLAHLRRGGRAGGKLFRGKHHTPETREKIGAARRGKKRSPFSPEWRAKIGAANRGRKLSPDHRAKVSVALKGKPKSPEHRARVRHARWHVYRDIVKPDCPFCISK